MARLRTGEMMISVGAVRQMMLTIMLTRVNGLRECKRGERKNEETHNDAPC